jgi:phage gp36-like protein
VSSATLQFTLKVSGTLTDATSVVLSDADVAYGVKRTDTGATIVSAGTAMTHASVGIYTYTISPEPTQGLTYNWVAKVVLNGATNYYEFNSAGTPLTATTGRYVTAAMIRERFGTANVRDWSDTESNGVEDSVAIARAIAWAESKIDMIFNNRGYTVPLVATTGTYPEVFLCWVYELAGGAWLYTKRGIDDKAEGVDGKMAGLVKKVDAEVRMYSGWPNQIPGLQLDSRVSFATAIVNPRTNYLSDGPTLYPSYQSRYFGERLVQGCGVVVQN